MKGENKRETAQAAKSAAPMSLAQIYTNHREELYQFVRGKVGSGPPDPEDIVQQAFANYAARDNPTSIENPGGFLVRTAHNLISDYFRRSATRLNITMDEARLEAALTDHDEISPEIVVLGRERFQCVMKALQALPRRQRRFLLLNRLNGLSYTAIAKANGVSVSTALREVESGVAACQAALARMLNDDDNQ